MAPVLSHAVTSQCWFILQTNKQRRKDVEKDTDLPQTTDTSAAASCASPPCFLLEWCIPTWGWGHICRDATSREGKAMKQELRSLCTHSPDLSLNSYWGGQARTRKSDRLNLPCHTKGKMDFGLQVWTDPHGFMYQKRMNCIDPTAVFSGQCNC